LKKNKISKNWVNKQRRDIYVRKSKVDGYRARSAYKLIEIDEKFKIFKGGLSVVDIGAAPGSWSQYSSKVIKNGKLISIDLKKMEPIGNSLQIQGDFTESDIQDEIKNNLNTKADVVLSDMAVNTTGIKKGKKYFKEVKVFKPKSSRKDSKESFIICRKIR
jgi:23S rRNA (uridine2552-2'-O)-methyltransferase